MNEYVIGYMVTNFSEKIIFTLFIQEYIFSILQGLSTYFKSFHHYSKLNFLFKNDSNNILLQIKWVRNKFVCQNISTKVYNVLYIYFLQNLDNQSTTIN